MDQNSLSPKTHSLSFNPTKILHNAMLVCVKCFFKQLSKSEATKPNKIQERKKKKKKKKPQKQAIVKQTHKWKNIQNSKFQIDFLI